jgi:putative phage-type endonuclease
MKFHTDIVQGSAQWHELRANYFTASEAAVMLGLSKYQTRSQLLHQKATGETEEVTPAKQKIFDRGHEVEELARPIAEAYIGDELFPATISNEIDGLPLLASMDGITMLGDKGFEHKMNNAELMALVNAGEVPDTHWPQLEHQMLVSGAEKILFVVSDGTEENRAQCWYESVPERRKQLISGWKQFQEDLANYVPEEKTEVVEADPVRELPAINYKMNGLALESNLEAYKQAALVLVEQSQKPLESDQDFANAEARQKVFSKAESDIKDACDRVMGEIDSIDAFVKDMRFIAENIRQARLAEGKQIKARKDEIRAEIMSQANADIIAAKNEAENKINANLPALSVNIANAMKGKRTIDSLKDAAAGEVARAKIEINEYVELAMGNALFLSTQAQGYDFLFNDWPQIAFKATDDFKALVKSRIADHKEREAKREEEQRARIRAEEEAKAKREAEAKLRAEEAAKRKAEQERQVEQQASATKAQAEVDKQSKQEFKSNEAPEVKGEPQTQPAQYLGHPNSKKPDTSKRKLSMIEINGIINFVSSITSSEETPFSEELARRADDYIQQHSSEAA